MWQEPHELFGPRNKAVETNFWGANLKFLVAIIPEIPSQIEPTEVVEKLRIPKCRRLRKK